MAKIESVGEWIDKGGRIINVVVSYDNADVKNFPGEMVLYGTLPSDVLAFVAESNERDVVHLSNGKTLKVWFN